MKWNWKTSTAGIISILAGIGQMSQEGWIPSAEVFGLWAVGAGLLFGKDHDATGGKRVIKKK